MAKGIKVIRLTRAINIFMAARAERKEPNMPMAKKGASASKKRNSKR